MYIGKRYKSMSGKTVNRAVYDCMNSWSFVQPFVSIEINSPAIKRIFSVIVDETPLTSGCVVTNKNPNKNHGSGCTGSCTLNEENLFI